MTNNTTKMTNKIALETALTYVPETETEVHEKLAKMIEQLCKKNASPKKLTAAQQETARLGEIILASLVPNTGYTVSDIISFVPEVGDKSAQKISAVMNSLEKAGRVTKYTEKRRTYFKVEGKAVEVEGE